jgi:hypothetical protein
MTINFQDIESIAVSLSVIASLYIFWRTPKYANIKERYEKLIFPLFCLIEPYLFKDYSKAPTNKVIQLIKDNAVYAGSRINEYAYYFNENCNQYNFNLLCRRIYHEYNVCSFILGLKTHSLSYRLNRKQYQSKFLLIAYMLGNILLLLIGIIFSLVLISALLLITQRLMGI